MIHLWTYLIGCSVMLVPLGVAFEASRKANRPFPFLKAFVIVAIWPFWVLYRVSVWSSSLD